MYGKPLTRGLSGQNSEPTIEYLLTVFDSGRTISCTEWKYVSLYMFINFIALNAGEENDQIW